VDCDNVTELSYWMENYTSGSQATFWVNISDSDCICMYYGNDVVSTTSNGDNTFVFFDDFSTQDMSKWDILASSPTWDTVNGLLLVDGSDFLETDNSFAINQRDVAKVRCSQEDAQLLSMQETGDGNSRYGWLSNDYTQGNNVNDQLLMVTKKDGTGSSIETPVHLDFRDWSRLEFLYIDATSVEFIWNGTSMDTETSNVLDVPTDTIHMAFKEFGTASQIDVDWVFIGLYAVTEPTFCNWTDEYEVSLSDFVVSGVIPVNNSEVLCVNLSTLCVDVNFSCGSGDYVNISINGEYTNDTTNVVNGTYCHTIVGNLTAGSIYIWYVNVSSSCGDDFNSSQFLWYNFTCEEGCDCVDELASIVYILDQIKGDDFDSDDDGLSVLLSGISIESGFFILILWFSLLLFGILMSKDVAVCAFGTVLFMMVGIFEMAVLTGFMSVIIWLLFLVSGSAIGVYRIVDNKKKVS